MLRQVAERAVGQASAPQHILLMQQLVSSAWPVAAVLPAWQQLLASHPQRAVAVLEDLAAGEGANTKPDHSGGERQPPARQDSNSSGTAQRRQQLAAALADTLLRSPTGAPPERLAQASWDACHLECWGNVQGGMHLWLRIRRQCSPYIKR